MAYVDPRRRTNHPLKDKNGPDTAIPSDAVLHVLLADILLVVSILGGKYWLLARGVGSLWLSINVLAGAGLGSLFYLFTRGRIALRGDIPWKSIAVAAGAIFAQHVALFYSTKRLDASRILLVAPFSAGVVRHIIRTHSVHTISVSLTAFLVSAAADTILTGASFPATLTAYIGLVIHGGLQVASSYTQMRFNSSFDSPMVAQAVTVVFAAACTTPIHLLGRTVGLLPLYPYVPTLSLIPLPLLAFTLLQYYPKALETAAFHSPISAYKLSYIPVAMLTCILNPLFSRQLLPSSIPFSFFFYYIFRSSFAHTRGNSGMAKSASEPFFRLVQGYLNSILSNSESKKIFYFLMVNMVYMAVQMLYGVWTNSLGLISDAIHMAFDCMAIAMGLFASVMATWKPNERFTYGYGRIETLSGFANGIFLILISVFIIVEAIQRLIDPPHMNTTQLLLVSTVGLAVNLFGMFAMGGHAHHGHSHSHGGHGHSHSGGEHDDHGHSHNYSPTTHDFGHHLIHHDHHHEHEDHHHHGHDQGHEHEEAYPHSHSNFHRGVHSHHESNDHEEGGNHSHNHGDHFYPQSNPGLRLHSRSHTASTPFTPEIRLESPKDSKKKFSTDSLASPSSIVYSPSAASNLPFSPVTPSYSFAYDEHLQTHHPESVHSYSHAPHEGHSHNMRGVFLHVLADTLGSVGVILSTILINIYGWTGFDPIASLFIAILIAASVFPLVMDTGRVLALDLGGKEVEVERALQEVSGVWGVQSYSDARFWPLEQGRIVGSIHVQIMPGLITSEIPSDRPVVSKLDRVRDGVEHVLKSKIKGLEELVIQLDG